MTEDQRFSAWVDAWVALERDDPERAMELLTEASELGELTGELVYQAIMYQSDAGAQRRLERRIERAKLKAHAPRGE